MGFFYACFRINDTQKDNNNKPHNNNNNNEKASLITKTCLAILMSLSWGLAKETHIFVSAPPNSPQISKPQKPRHKPLVGGHNQTPFGVREGIASGWQMDIGLGEQKQKNY